MKALLIKDELVWRDSSSVELGEHLDIMDSSNNMLIFQEGSSEKEILNIISDVPKSAYQLLDLEAAPETDCDFMADSGSCYRQIE